MTISNAINNIQFTSVNIVTFTSNGTYTPPANLLWAQVECVGGGGGSGGRAATGSGQGSCAGSGGSGSYLRKVYARSSLTPNVAVTVGAAGTAGAAGNTTGGTGGSTTFLTLTAAGGLGSSNNGPSNNAYSNGGAGGTATNGDLNIAGNNGNPASIGFASPNTYAVPNTTPGPFGGSTVAGSAATGFIGGGGGGSILNPFSAGQSGHAGGDGIVIITEYLSA